jgi:hypothetical protein
MKLDKKLMVDEDVYFSDMDTEKIKITKLIKI